MSTGYYTTETANTGSHPSYVEHEYGNGTYEPIFHLVTMPLDLTPYSYHPVDKFSIVGVDFFIRDGRLHIEYNGNIDTSAQDFIDALLVMFDVRVKDLLKNKNIGLERIKL